MIGSEFVEFVSGLLLFLAIIPAIGMGAIVYLLLSGQMDFFKAIFESLRYVIGLAVTLGFAVVIQLLSLESAAKLG